MRSLSPSKKVPPNFTLTDRDKEYIGRKLDAARYIFIQRTSDDFHLEWLQSSKVAASYPNKTWIWPNIYFDGYFPRTRYIYLQGGGKLLSPLDEYHLHPIVEAFKAGRSLEYATQQLKSDASGIDPLEESLGRLRAREQDCTVHISDYISDQVVKSKCFYTPNHPHTALLVEMAKRLAEAAGLPFDMTKAAASPYKLDKIDIAPFPWIAQRGALGFEPPKMSKGVDVTNVNGAQVTLGGSHDYGLEELVEVFYKIYRAALRPY